MICIFGDSHSVIWGGRIVNRESEKSIYAGIQTFHLKGALAYNLYNLEEQKLGKWGQLIFHRMEQLPNGIIDAVILTFGEIDIRVHSLKVIISRKIAPLIYADEIAERLFKTAVLIAETHKVQTYIVAPIPSATNYIPKINASVPVVGSFDERLFITKLVEQRLSAKTRAHSLVETIPTVAIFTNEDETLKQDLYSDGYHVNHNGFKLLKHEFLLRSSNLGYYYHTKFLEKGFLEASEPCVKKKI